MRANPPIGNIKVTILGRLKMTSIEGVFLDWAKPKNGYKLIVPTDDEKLIWEADKAILKEAEKGQMKRAIRHRGQSEYVPTKTQAARLAKYKGATLTTIGGANRPVDRIVPDGDPLWYRLTPRIAEKALDDMLKVDRFDYVAFANKYGSLRYCPFIKSAHDDWDINLGHWRQGDALADIDRSRASFRKAAERAAKTKIAFASDFNMSNLGHYRLRFEKDQTSGRLVPAFEPSSLLGMLWYVLACASFEGVSMRRCSQCSQMMIILSGLTRSDKALCSKACTMQASRARRAK